MNNEINTISKFMSLVLRHQPEKINIKLDSSGWVNVDEFVRNLKLKFHDFNLEKLEIIVRDNDKKRFEFNENKTKIRASQGHSIDIELNFPISEPPDLLFHGTSESNYPSILKTGINKGKRHQVHLTENIETANKVGSRYGKPLVIKINSKKMFEESINFYKSTNDVWLTDFVNTKYFI